MVLSWVVLVEHQSQTLEALMTSSTTDAPRKEPLNPAASQQKPVLCNTGTH